jgi:hypothetical protein
MAASPQRLQHGDDIVRLGAAGEVDVDEGVADDAAAIDDIGGGDRNEPAVIAMPLRKIGAETGQHLAGELRHREQHAELHADRAVDIGQDLIAQPMRPLGRRQMAAGIGRQRDQLAARRGNARQRRLQRHQGAGAIGTPVAAKEIDDQRPFREQLVGEDQPTLGIGQHEARHDVADLEGAARRLRPVELRHQRLIGRLDSGMGRSFRADPVELVLQRHVVGSIPVQGGPPQRRQPPDKDHGCMSGLQYRLVMASMPAHSPASRPAADPASPATCSNRAPASA